MTNDVRRRHLKTVLWDNRTLADLILAGLRRRPRQGIRLRSNRIGRDGSFATLDYATRQFASGLVTHGIRAGDRVVLWQPNWWKALVTFVGSTIRGATNVPTATFFGRKDVVPVASMAPREEGEIFTRGPDRCAGYLQQQANTAFDAGGWLATEDIGVSDAEGYLAVADRSKDLITRNGIDIAPAGVENALLTAPGVAEVAVVGIPDPRTGERAIAVVVPVAGHRVTLNALTDHLASLGVAKPKWAEALHMTDHLPRTASGKV